MVHYNCCFVMWFQSCDGRDGDGRLEEYGAEPAPPCGGRLPGARQPAEPPTRAPAQTRQAVIGDTLTCHLSTRTSLTRHSKVKVMASLCSRLRQVTQVQGSSKCMATLKLSLYQGQGHIQVKATSGSKQLNC